MPDPLLAQATRIPPSRGLVLTHNRRGKPFSLLDQKRWLRYSRLAYKTDKTDVLSNNGHVAPLEELLEAAKELDVALSLRTDAASLPDALPGLARRGLHDVFLCPETLDDPALGAWLDTCAENDVPIRLQLNAPFGKRLGIHQQAPRLAQAGVRMVNLALHDPFHEPRAATNGVTGRDTLDVMQRFAEALEEHGVEANLLHVPFCLLGENQWVRVANAQQCALDHSQYMSAAHELAAALYRRAPFMARQAILVLLARESLHTQPVDNILLPWLIHRKYVHFWSRAVRRVTRHLKPLRAVPSEVTKDTLNQELERARNRARKDLGAACSACRLRRICDHHHGAAQRVLPGVEVRPREGELVVSPAHFCAAQKKYYDPIDAERLRQVQDGDLSALARDAQDLVQSRSADVLLTSSDYGVEHAYFDRMEGGVKWWSVSNVEKLSTALARVSPPFTVSVGFGGGIADFIGFSLGRHCKIVCPMESYRHSLTLHVDSDGRYVLLRDEKPVQPSVFEGRHYLPLRLGGPMEPRISIWNIDESISTQNVQIWTGGAAPSPDLSQIEYSVIVVSTRFTRRLHAVIRCIAHQTGFDLDRIEIVVAYVPGLDATDDLIDSVTLAYPELRVVRAPFAETDATAKGFMINEALQKTAGEWTVLLDSDTLLPPDMFAKIDAVSDTAEFIAPDGRKLLTKETTAKILMGELNPWDHWQELLDGPGEFRHRETNGVPVGFCQVVRTKHLREFPYAEVRHFENADMWFGQQMLAAFGPEHRLSGTPVLHLDHGGSQWYGTQKHL